MLHQYYDFQYVLRLPVSNITRLLTKAFKKREEEKAWDMWVARYPYMDKKNFISFNDFLKKFEAPVHMQASLHSPDESVHDRYQKMKMKIKKPSK